MRVGGNADVGGGGAEETGSLASGVEVEHLSPCRHVVGDWIHQLLCDQKKDSGGESDKSEAKVPSPDN